MRKIILYIAMSLDGFIADKYGNVDWLCGHDNDKKDTGSYSEFIKTVDTVILGYHTYHQIVTELSPDSWFYSGMKSYVMTQKQLTSTDEIEFTNRNISELISVLKQSDGLGIWICGGADIVNQLIRLNLIDIYHITVIPTILGDGIRLFQEINSEIKLHLLSSEIYNGMVDLVYESRVNT